jgi:ABC-2 type transport system ATP-binding protein
MKLKASIPAESFLEVGFSAVPEGWVETLRNLPDVERVIVQDSVFRLASQNGPRTTTALMEAAREAGITVQTLTVQSTTLDDVFTHYTGRQLRDALQEATYDVSFLYQRR